MTLKNSEVEDVSVAKGQKVEQVLDPSHTISSAFMWISGSHVNLFAPNGHLQESKCHQGTIDVFLLNAVGMSGFFSRKPRIKMCWGQGKTV